MCCTSMYVVRSQHFDRMPTDMPQAGIGYPDKDWLPAGQSLSKCIMETMRTNVAGAAQTAESFIPLLQKAENPRIVFISTALGSLKIAEMVKGVGKTFPAYSASKAALNMVMLYFWGRFGEVMRVNACSPGFRVSLCLISRRTRYVGVSLTRGTTVQATNLNGYGAAGRIGQGRSAGARSSKCCSLDFAR